MTPEELEKLSSGSVELVRQLVDQGLDVGYRDAHGNALLWFCGNPGRAEKTKLLVAAGGNLANPGFNNHSLLGLAAFAGDWQRVTELLELGAAPDQVRPETGETPLHLATSKINMPGTCQCVWLLLEHGAKPNLRTLKDVGSDCFNGNLWVVEETALHRAAAYGEIEMIQTLLEHDGDISTKDCYGYLPLDWAARTWRNHDILRLLGGDP